MEMLSTSKMKKKKPNPTLFLEGNLESPIKISTCYDSLIYCWVFYP